MIQSTIARPRQPREVVAHEQVVAQVVGERPAQREVPVQHLVEHRPTRTSPRPRAARAAPTTDSRAATSSAGSPRCAPDQYESSSARRRRERRGTRAARRTRRCTDATSSSSPRTTAPRVHTGRERDRRGHPRVQHRRASPARPSTRSPTAARSSRCAGSCVPDQHPHADRPIHRMRSRRTRRASGPCPPQALEREDRARPRSRCEGPRRQYVRLLRTSNAASGPRREANHCAVRLPCAAVPYSAY